MLPLPLRAHYMLQHPLTRPNFAGLDTQHTACTWLLRRHLKRPFTAFQAAALHEPQAFFHKIYPTTTAHMPKFCNATARLYTFTLPNPKVWTHECNMIRGQASIPPWWQQRVCECRESGGTHARIDNTTKTAATHMNTRCRLAHRNVMQQTLHAVLGHLVKRPRRHSGGSTRRTATTHTHCFSIMGTGRFAVASPTAVWCRCSINRCADGEAVVTARASALGQLWTSRTAPTGHRAVHS